MAKTETLTLAEVADVLRVTPERVSFMRDQGTLPFVRLVGDQYVGADAAVALVRSGAWAAVLRDDLKARIAADQELNAAIAQADAKRIADRAAVEAATQAKSARFQHGKKLREDAANEASRAASGTVKI
jgi:hypothetical protein